MAIEDVEDHCHFTVLREYASELTRQAIERTYLARRAASLWPGAKLLRLRRAELKKIKVDFGISKLMLT